MKRRTLLKAGGAAVVLAVGGLLFAWSGLFNIGASTGHWAITAWFLHFAMRNSVETHSMGIEAPARFDLTDSALVARGAGHYDQGCAPCHGTPGVPPNPVVHEMTPHPPHLVDRIGRWDPGELFWIVKHGVKFTGMPAWPARQRDDEVWAVTAFLLRLPELSPAEYERLAQGEMADGDVVAEGETGQGETDSGLDQEAVLAALSDPLGPALANCARCHGRDGMGRGEGAFPILAGQKERYLYESLKSYVLGARFSGIMELAAHGLDEDAIAALARHYAGSGAGLAADTRDPEPAGEDGAPGGGGGGGQSPDHPGMIGEGETIARSGVAKAGIPDCVSCHGPSTAPRHPIYPRLAGQHPDYLAQQLRLFRTGARGGTPYAHIMRAVASRLTDRQIEAVSRYYADLSTGAPGE